MHVIRGMHFAALRSMPHNRESWIFWVYEAVFVGPVTFFQTRLQTLRKKEMI